MMSPLVQELLEARFPDFTPAVLRVIDGAFTAGMEPTGAEVCEKVLATIKALKQPSFRGSQPLTVEDMAQLIKQALEYEAQLESTSADQLQELYRDHEINRQNVRYRKALTCDNFKFGHPRHEPDFDFWNKRLVWSVADAICLSLNKNPNTISFDSDFSGLSLLGEEYEIRKMAMLSMTGLKIDSIKPISFFTAWFIDNGILTPPAFGKAKALGAPDTQQMIETLQAENAILRKELDKSRPKTNRTASMQAMIYCLAVEKYGYDPLKKQNAAIANIEACMRKIASVKGNEQLKSSNNTVRDILREAAEFVSEVDPPIGA